MFHHNRTQLHSTNYGGEQYFAIHIENIVTENMFQLRIACKKNAPYTKRIGIQLSVNCTTTLLYFIHYIQITFSSSVKGACSSSQSHLLTFFFKLVEILVPDVESYLVQEILRAKWHVQNLCSLKEFSDKPSSIVENRKPCYYPRVITFYKTISNTSIFSLITCKQDTNLHFWMIYCLKVFVLIHSLILQLFSNIWRFILYHAIMIFEWH